MAVRPPEYQEFGIRRVAEIVCAPDVEKRFYDALNSQLGKPFDNEALYTFLSPDVSTDRDWRETETWFCSELITWALETAGLWPYKILVSKNRVSPADSLLLVNPYVANTDTFWNPVQGLKLGAHER